VTKQTSASPAFRFVWQPKFEASLKESNPKKLLEAVHAAETGIFNRLQELAERSTRDPSQQAEQQAIAEALRTLRIVKRDKLGFPDWEAK